MNETTLCGSIRDLNLNLPPPSSSSIVSSPEIANLDSTPVVPKTENNKKLVELVEPVGEMQPNNFQETKFPINDTLLVDSGASNSLSTGPSVPFPIIHKLDLQSPPLPIASAKEYALKVSGKKAGNGASSSNPCAGLSVPNPIIHVPDPPPSAATELPIKKEVEEKLLRELEEMGFKQIDLNKEILRMNGYDLEQAVDDLCDVADWDPLLEELQEMK
jgi:next-to-BRCA1 protein 1